MKLIDFLEMIPETQEVFLSYEGFKVCGTQESLICMLCEDVYSGIVFEIEAEGDVLKIWAREKKDENA